MTPELQAMLDQLEAIKKEGQAVAAGLTDAQFNWRPGKGKWSIAECLQHLNIGVQKTLPAFDRAIAEGRSKGKTAPGPFRYGWFSRWMIAEMEPPPKRRLTTPSMLRVPQDAAYQAAVLLPEFQAVRDQLAARVRQADGLDLARIRTTSPVNRLLRLPLGAYFQFIIAHDRRHVWQARQVRNVPGFGGAQSP
jgi:hypothetical protein